jgi:hypothetical protein
MKRRRPTKPLPQRAARMLRRLKSVRGLTDAKKSVYALGLAATPEERWELAENFIRSLGYWKPSRRKISGLFDRQVGQNIGGGTGSAMGAKTQTVPYLEMERP